MIEDWHAAGLKMPSAFRMYLGMKEKSAVRPVGKLSARDWQAVRDCAREALG